MKGNLMDDVVLLSTSERMSRRTSMSQVQVQVHEVPVDADVAELKWAYEISVPTEDGRWCVVNVTHNVVRDTYKVEWTAALMDQAPQALTATVQLVMLAIQERRA